MSLLGWRSCPKLTASHQLARHQDQQRHCDGSNRIDVSQRIEADAPGIVGRVVAEVAGGIAVRSFVQSDGEGHRDRRKRNHLDQTSEVEAHGLADGSDRNAEGFEATLAYAHDFRQITGQVDDGRHLDTAGAAHQRLDRERRFEGVTHQQPSAITDSGPRWEGEWRR
jgi:hypothetical protein